jgi:hypothetical protein
MTDAEILDWMERQAVHTARGRDAIGRVLDVVHSGRATLRDAVYEHCLDELLSFVCGRFPGLSSGGITTYPNGDDNARKLHAGCEELERRQLIERHLEETNFVVWRERHDD